MFDEVGRGGLGIGIDWPQQSYKKILEGPTLHSFLFLGAPLETAECELIR
jgi:hypothetical protein